MQITQEGITSFLVKTSIPPHRIQLADSSLSSLFFIILFDFVETLAKPRQNSQERCFESIALLDD